MSRVRRNPLDVDKLVAARVPVGVVMGLKALDDAGVKMVDFGSVIGVDAASAARARMSDELRGLAAAFGAVVAFNAGPLKAQTREIVASLTRTFFVMGWYTYSEEHDGRTDPFEAAPTRMPRDVRAFAKAYIERFERANGMPIGVVYQLASAAPGRHYHEPTPERFGHDIAMQAIGTGVCWTDDHPDIGMKVPYGEWYY